MKRFFLGLLALLLLLSLCGCKKSAGELKFYVLSAGDLKESMSDSDLLALAKSKGRLAFTDEQLSGWRWAEHEVKLKDPEVRGGARDGGSRLFQAGPQDLFVLALGGQLIYVGGFTAGSGTVTPTRSPYIADLDDSTFAIRFDSKYTDRSDPRGNERLYSFLTDRQLLVSRFQ